MAASSLEHERLRPGSLLYIDPAWPVVMSYKSQSDSWDDCTSKSPFPTMTAAKKAADITAAENGHHAYVVNQRDEVVYEAHPKPPAKRRVVRRPPVK